MRKLERKNRNFEEFLKVLNRSGKPEYLPFYEHLASPSFIAARTGTRFDAMSPSDPGYWEIYVTFWLEMGFDNIPLEIPLNCPLPAPSKGRETVSVESESRVVFRNPADIERYPWPAESDPIDFKPFEIVSKLLPDGVKIVGGVCAGPYEWASMMMGTVGMSYALADCPEMVETVFQRLGRLHENAHRQLASMDSVGALRQGDDLGFKTATFLPPELLRLHVFPIYSRLTETAHAHGKPFILHSCGNLSEVYDDLIHTCRIDAKHSFEDVIMPVAEFKRRYGRSVTALGGLDVDTLCRSSPSEIRRYARRMIEECWSDGWWALGTGNSLTNYLPVENYIIVLEEGMKATI